MMNDNFYSASLSRTQGRNIWAVIFRHPKRTDPTTGKEGLRVRQSLKTDNEQEAATLRVPVHRHERKRDGPTPSAYTVMHQLAWELIPSLEGVFADLLRLATFLGARL